MKRIALAALLTSLIGCTGKFTSGDLPTSTPDPDQEIVPDDKELEGKIPSVDECKEVAVDPGPFNARRMTDWEIVRTVNQSFGVDISVEAADALPKDDRVSGFSNTGSGLVTSIDHIKAYEALSQVIVTKLGDWPTFVANHTSCTDDTPACRSEFVENAGFKAFRRPLVAAETELFIPLFDAAVVEGDDFNVGAELVVRAMLQSPQFLFRLEAQETDSGALKQLAGYEVASRLSYLIWATAPDDALYAAAAADALKTDVEISEQITRMLADPKAREASTRYVRDWLGLDNIDGLVRDEFPEFTPSVMAGMKEETLTYFEKQIWEDDVPVAQLFTAQHTYANRELAEFYQFDNPQDGLQRYDLTGQPERIGFLTHAGILALAGKASDPSLVERGLFVMNGIFCDSVVNTLDVVPTMPELEAGRSQRFYSELRLQNPGCQNCHKQFDPLGSAFERFDGVGMYVTNDNYGNELLESGSFIVDKSTDETVDFSSIADFVQKASETELARDCMIKKPVQFAIGRSLIGSDACMLAGIKANFDPTTSTYKDLIREIALSPYFRSVRSASNDTVN